VSASRAAPVTLIGSVFTLEPTRQKIVARLDAGAVARSGVELRLVAVSLDSGAIRYVTQAGGVIERDGRPVVGPNPTLCRAERNAYNAAMAAKTAAGKAVNQAKPEDRQEAIAEYKAASLAADQAKGALDACLAAEGSTQLTVTLEAGTMASSAIPCIFPPVVMGDEAYVDGGIRWTLPLQTAVDFDPELIVAVNTAPAGVPPPGRHYKDATIPDIAERSVFGLELWEPRRATCVRRGSSRRSARRRCG
jgi:NTE family protein